MKFLCGASGREGSGKGWGWGAVGIPGFFSQFSLSCCTARPRLKWSKEALDQLKRKQRINYFRPCPHPNMALPDVSEGWGRRWYSGMGEGSGVGGEEHLANDPVLLTVALLESHHLPP